MFLNIILWKFDFSFTFEMFLYSAVFQIFDIREKNHFWHSKPSLYLFLAMMIDFIAGIVIGLIGLPGLTPISIYHLLFVIGMTFFFFLPVNDFIKNILYRKGVINW